MDLPPDPKQAAVKHHIDIDALAVPPLMRERSCDYRLKCSACSGDIIGPRFSCINCADGLECCVSCAGDRGLMDETHARDHVFRIVYEDEHPFATSPLAPPSVRCCICLSEHEEEMLSLESCMHSAHRDCLLGQLGIHEISQLVLLV